MGEALRPVRDQVAVGTKFGVTIMPDHSFVYDSSREAVRATIEKSLRQTGFEVTDVDFLLRANAICPVTTNASRMRENLATADIVLSTDELAGIDRRLEEIRPETFGVE